MHSGSAMLTASSPTIEHTSNVKQNFAALERFASVGDPYVNRVRGIRCRPAGQPGRDGSSRSRLVIIRYCPTTAACRHYRNAVTSGPDS